MPFWLGLGGLYLSLHYDLYPAGVLLSAQIDTNGVLVASSVSLSVGTGGVEVIVGAAGLGLQ